MKSFSEICYDFYEFCREFLSADNFAICEKLIYQLKTIENNGFLKPGDYNAFGCEFILNGMNIGTHDYSLTEVIEERFKYNAYSHSFNLVNNWDTFLFFSPKDFRGLIFDFGNLYSDGKVICYNGLNGPKNLEKVNEYNIDQFLNEYGLSKFYSISHWNVHWEKLGVNWNN